MVDNPGFCFLAFSFVCSSILLLFFFLRTFNRIRLSKFGSYNNRKSQRSKRLEAEEKRRKDLKDGLFTLRFLVPKRSNLDRPSILTDTIEFVKDLLKQVKDLEDQLEQEQDDDTSENDCYILKQNQQEILDALNHKQTREIKETKVEVIEGNHELVVKVLCEQRPDGFLKLMEAFNTLRIKITHASVTTHKGLVSNIFKLQKMENEVVGAEDIRDSLVELIK